MITAKIKELGIARLEKGWSRTKLAENAKVSASSVCRIEQGLPANPTTAKKLADALGKTVGDLFNYES
jgi:DNA-binding XRE family transcriptional regulator